MNEKDKEEVLDALFGPKPAAEYRDLTRGGECTVMLTQDEATAVLKSHDYGIGSLSKNEQDNMHDLIAKLKNQLCP